MPGPQRTFPITPSRLLKLWIPNLVTISLDPSIKLLCGQMWEQQDSWIPVSSLSTTSRVCWCVVRNYPFNNPSKGSCQSWQWFQGLEDEDRELHQGQLLLLAPQAVSWGTTNHMNTWSLGWKTYGQTPGKGWKGFCTAKWIIFNNFFKFTWCVAQTSLK